jgi:hypothetical protein
MPRPSGKRAWIVGLCSTFEGLFICAPGAAAGPLVPLLLQPRLLDDAILVAVVSAVEARSPTSSSTRFPSAARSAALFSAALSALSASVVAGSSTSMCVARAAAAAASAAAAAGASGVVLVVVVAGRFLGGSAFVASLQLGLRIVFIISISCVLFAVVVKRLSSSFRQPFMHAERFTAAGIIAIIALKRPTCSEEPQV